MADAKITQLPIASITSSDVVPFAKVSSSVTSATTYQNFIQPNGTLPLTAVSSPMTPVSSVVGLFGRNKGGRMMPAFIGPSGLDTTLQPLVGVNKVAVWSHSGNSNAITAPTLFLWNFAHVAGNVEGQVTARNVVPSSLLTSMRRLGQVTSVASSNLSVGMRQLVPQHFIGNSSTFGGFHYIARFGYTTAKPGNRGFVGMSSTTAAFTVTADPTATGTGSTGRCLGLGFDAADTTWQVITRDVAASVATKINTGIPKPVDNDVYEVNVFVPPSTYQASFSLQHFNSGSIFTTTRTTDLPAPNVFVLPRIWGNSGTTVASNLALDVVTQYLETDY